MADPITAPALTDDGWTEVEIDPESVEPWVLRAFQRCERCGWTLDLCEMRGGCDDG
jgi:hypothetical protein